jgi:hypothetical protein
MLILGRLNVQVGDLLAPLGKCNQSFTRHKITKQLAFLIVSSTSAQISSHSCWLNP